MVELFLSSIASDQVRADRARSESGVAGASRAASARACGGWASTSSFLSPAPRLYSQQQRALARHVAATSYGASAAERFEKAALSQRHCIVLSDRCGVACEIRWLV